VPCSERASWTLSGLAVLCQIGYPLTSGQTRTALTIVTVVVFFLATATAVRLGYGTVRTLAYLAVTAGGGLLVEAAGVHTGWPFGRYAYADTLGPKLLGVPLVIPLAWAMMAYPALLVGRRLSRRLVRRAALTPLVAGWALASWDVFLDPQMVTAGHWRWLDDSPALPGVPGVPLSNFAGWLAVAVAMAAVLDRVLAPGRVPDGPPAMLYLWTYLSSVLANAALFGRPSVALAGGVLMGLVAVPYALSLAVSRTGAAERSSPRAPLPR
jgi:carotene biosynthesis associated membrane protein